MDDVTLFAIPKPFTGHVGVIQWNALRSWRLLEPPVRILLVGAEEGTADAARAIGAVHVPHVERNEYGTPLVDSIFREAHRLAAGRGLLAYLNADIILVEDFVEALARVPLPRFLLAGRRRNIEVDDELAFGPRWQVEIRRRAARGRLEKPWGSDYFVFPADGAFDTLPPFAIGRARWDNWLIGQARCLGIPVVDATRAITAIHQTHDHRQIAEYTGSDWGGPESSANAELARRTLAADVIFHLRDSTHVLDRSGLHPVVRPIRLWRRWRTRHARPWRAQLS